jgi:hypothetical protein
MTNVLTYAAETYFGRLGLLLMFSLSFVIALLIPIFASLPAYNDIGAVFVRTSSIFVNLNVVSSAVIIASTLFSLLFLSFAIVAINVIVKHSRTHVKVSKEVINGIEKYTGRVFLVLLLFTAIIMAANLAAYGLAASGISGAVVGLLFTPFFFYAPSSIVIDDRGMWQAMRASVSYFAKRFDYFLLWLVIAIIAITLFDLIFITVSGTVISRYAMLVFDSLFIAPFLVVLQSQMYMKRFALLKR